MKKNLIIPLLFSLTLCSCATMEQSIFAGAGITGAFGTGVGAAASGDAGGALIGLGIGAVVGGALGYLGHKDQEAKNKLPKSTAMKKDDPKTPSLTSPEVRRVWVPEKIDGDRFIDGHYMYLIERNSVWSK